MNTDKQTKKLKKFLVFLIRVYPCSSVAIMVSPRMPEY
jgi:nitrate reductase NapE component